MSNYPFRPVLSRLHPVLIQPEEPNEPIADWLTAFEDEWLWWQQNRGREFALSWCDPAQCPDFALDWLASLIAADFEWDGSWMPVQKRRILVNLRWLRETRGSAETFRWFLSNFDLNATFESNGGWIVGGVGVASTLPALLSGGPFQWVLRYSANYVPSSREFVLLESLVMDWLPCWVDVQMLAVL